MWFRGLCENITIIVLEFFMIYQHFNVWSLDFTCTAAMQWHSTNDITTKYTTICCNLAWAVRVKHDEEKRSEKRKRITMQCKRGRVTITAHKKYNKNKNNNNNKYVNVDGEKINIEYCVIMNSSSSSRGGVSIFCGMLRKFFTYTSARAGVSAIPFFSLNLSCVMHIRYCAFATKRNVCPVRCLQTPVDFFCALILLSVWFFFFI